MGESPQHLIDVSPTKEPSENLNDSFEIVWTNIKYTVTNSFLYRGIRRVQGFKKTPKTREILHGLSGRIQAGEMMAFMGPSGAGKSTLLECIVGKRVKRKTGDTLLLGENLSRISVSFIAQHNDFLRLLTVRETIIFATKLQIATKVHDGTFETLYDEHGKQIISRPGGTEYCSIVADRVIADLGLQVCANNRISGCSGGQLKRLAIAEQLVAKPRILVLDEPTSGLDSVSCFQVTNTLLKLTQQDPKIAVLATIHQPSLKVLNLFHKLYVLSENGYCIFDDSPSNIVDKLMKFGFKCPLFYNPADFIMEVAIGEHGTDKFQEMSTSEDRVYDLALDVVSNTRQLSDLYTRKSYPTLTHIFILLWRDILTTLRDPLVIFLRFGSTIGAAIYQIDLFTTRIGIRGGCPPKFDADFEPSNLDEIADEIEEEMETIFNSVGNFLFGLMLVMFNAMMPTSVLFTNELHVFKTQKDNSWYDAFAFFIGKMAAEFPIQLFTLMLYVPLLYIFQHHPLELWRFMCIASILLLAQLIAQSMAYIMSAVFMYNLPAAVFITPLLSFIPFVLISGFFIKIRSMNTFFEVLSYASYLRFSMEGLMIALYGFDRCNGEAAQKLVEGKEAFVVWFGAMIGAYGDGEPENSSSNSSKSMASEKFVEELTETFSGDFINERNEVGSAVMNLYGFEDWHLYRAISILIITTIVLRLIAFQLIKMRVKGVH